MSDTPRTDAAVRDVDVAFVGHWGLSSEPQEFVSPEFTRELERENAALRADKERLDWLEASGEPETYEDDPHALVWYVFGETDQRSIRDAIDAARAKEGQP